MVFISVLPQPYLHICKYVCLCVCIYIALITLDCFWFTYLPPLLDWGFLRAGITLLSISLDHSPWPSINWVHWITMVFSKIYFQSVKKKTPKRVKWNSLNNIMVLISLFLSTTSPHSHTIHFLRKGRLTYLMASSQLQNLKNHKCLLN